MAVIQFKRGTAEALARNNLVFAEGEPIFVTDENRMKIGDGVTPWNDLPDLCESYVVNAKTRYDFPSIGKENVIYKAESERLLYQWSTTGLKYEVVGEAIISGDLASIEVINGGNASD